MSSVRSEPAATSKARSWWRRPVAIGRTGDPKDLGHVARIIARMLREDTVIAARHYTLVRLAGAYLIPRPVRFLLYRLAGVRVEQADIAPGITITGPPRNLSIGHGTSMNVKCFFDCAGRVRIGRRVMIGMEVMIVTSDHPIGEDGRPCLSFTGRDVVIEDGVWLGARVTVLPGVTIGEGAVISAGSVVSRDCRPNAIYAGVPARLVGQLPADA